LWEFLINNPRCRTAGRPLFCMQSKSKEDFMGIFTKSRIAFVLMSCAALLFAACDSGSAKGSSPKTASVNAATPLSSTIGSTAPSVIALNFSLAVYLEDTSVAGFALEGSEEAATVIGIASDGSKNVTLKLNGRASQGETIKLSYFGENIKTKGNQKKVEPFEVIVANGAPDIIPPHLASATITSAERGKFVLVFDEEIKPDFALNNGAAIGFDVFSEPEGLAIAASPCVFSNGTFTFALTSPALNGQHVYLDYFGTTIKDLADNPLADIVGRTITNESPPNLTLTLDWNGAAGSGSDGPLYVSVGTLTELPVAGTSNSRVKTGYSHTGWYDGTTTINNGTSYAPVTNITLTAVWAVSEYDITYNNLAAGAASNPASNLAKYTSATATFTLANPISTNGMVFLRWRDASGGTVTQIELGSTGNKNLIAEWSLPDQNTSVSENTLLSITALYPDSPYAGGAVNLAAIAGNHVNLGFLPAAVGYFVDVPSSRTGILLIARPKSTKAEVRMVVGSAEEVTGSTGADVYTVVPRPATGTTVVVFTVAPGSGAEKQYTVTVSKSGPSATLSGAPVISATKANNGVGGVAVQDNTVLPINLTNATVKTALSGVNNALSWFAPTIAGLSYTATAGAGATGISIAVTGTPTAISSADAVITIPAGKLLDSSGADITSGLVVTGTATYNIGEASAATYTYSFTHAVNSLAIQGVGCDVIFSPLSPQPAGTHVTVTVNLSGMVMATGTFTTNFTSVNANLNGEPRNQYKQGLVGARLSAEIFEFDVPEMNADDFILTRSFQAAN
jgi:hypothetical protein